MQIITRKAARAAGAVHYFTNRLCVRNHLELRFVRGGACRGCVREYSREHRLKKLYVGAPYQRLRVADIYVTHVDDLAAVRLFVQSLNMARSISNC